MEYQEFQSFCQSIRLDRPWLTTVIDTYSRCIVGINLGFDAPSSKLVALALRHAILPKKYSSDYRWYEDWPTSGVPKHVTMVAKIFAQSIWSKLVFS